MIFRISKVLYGRTNTSTTAPDNKKTDTTMPDDVNPASSSTQDNTATGPLAHHIVEMTRLEDPANSATISAQSYSATGPPAPHLVEITRVEEAAECLC